MSEKREEEGEVMSFIFIYGRPGSGKSTLAASMTKLGLKGVFVDIDDKIRSMKNLQSLLEQGKIEVVPIESKLVNVSLRQRILTPKIALAKQPKGYLEFCEIISGYEKEIEEGKSRQDQFLTVDSLSTLLEHLDRLISNIQGKDNFTFDEYNILLTNLEEFFYTMKRLQKLFKHVIITAHQQTEVDQSTGRVTTILPMIRGSMRNKVSMYFEEVYHTEVESSRTSPKYKVATVELNKAEARSSRSLPPLVDSDFEILFADELPAARRLALQSKLKTKVETTEPKEEKADE